MFTSVTYVDSHTTLWSCLNPCVCTFQSQGHALRVSFAATMTSASRGIGSATTTTTAETTQMSETAVSIKTHFLVVFLVFKNTTSWLFFFQSCWRVAQVSSSVTRVTVSQLLWSVTAGPTVWICQTRLAVVSKQEDLKKQPSLHCLWTLN